MPAPAPLCPSVMALGVSLQFSRAHSYLYTGTMCRQFYHMRKNRPWLWKLNLTPGGSQGKEANSPESSGQGHGPSFLHASFIPKAKLYQAGRKESVRSVGSLLW